eukprot:TRINITY_DN2977_c0_g1_i1.p3 TRINITY_DN2977_c0_g1~~TRINITY_DN2977_c0_g1_i1.p3  ORF type:complete len:158 (-),score=35.49 TRINITY_DN2977_c0_g1_i1:380-853(-)
MMALKTPSPVARAKATGFRVLACSIQKREGVWSRALRILAGSRRGKPTRTKTVLRSSRLREEAELWRTKPRERRSESETERGGLVEEKEKEEEIDRVLGFRGLGFGGREMGFRRREEEETMLRWMSIVLLRCDLRCSQDTRKRGKMVDCWGKTIGGL